jgi:shikimate dehydrogenase
MGSFYTLEDLKERRTGAAVLSVFGDPVAHSLSPQLHNPALKACGIPGEYVRIQVAEADFAEAMRLIQQQGFHGTNVTIPHKFTALKSVDVVTPQAQRLGAVNTVVFRKGKAEGRNSDGPGFVRAVQEGLGAAVRDLRILIIGAGGGAGRAVAVQCALESCQQLVLVNRSLDKVQALEAELGEFYPKESVAVAPWNQESLEHWLPRVDLVINGTNLGMKPDDESVLLGNEVSPQHLVYDMVYRPYETEFTKQASAKGAKWINGLPMLLHQGAVSFEWWFDQPAPLEVMRQGLWAAVEG